MLRYVVVEPFADEMAELSKNDQFVRSQSGQQQLRCHLEYRVFNVGHRLQLILKCRFMMFAFAQAFFTGTHEIKIVAALRCDGIRQ